MLVLALSRWALSLTHNHTLTAAPLSGSATIAGSERIFVHFATSACAQSESDEQPKPCGRKLNTNNKNWQRIFNAKK